MATMARPSPLISVLGRQGSECSDDVSVKVRELGGYPRAGHSRAAADGWENHRHYQRGVCCSRALGKACGGRSQPSSVHALAAPPASRSRSRDPDGWSCCRDDEADEGGPVWPLLIQRGCVAKA